MVENAVVTSQLTDAMVDAGAALTHKLDEMGVKPTAAFWFLMPDVNEWRLLIASPEVATKGPLDVYKRIQDALGQLGQVAAAAPFSAIGLLEADAELVRSLRLAVNTGPGISRVRFSKNAINGHYIEDALLYRVT